MKKEMLGLRNRFSMICLLAVLLPPLSLLCLADRDGDGAAIEGQGGTEAERDAASVGDKAKDVDQKREAVKEESGGPVYVGRDGTFKRLASEPELLAKPGFSGKKSIEPIPVELPEQEAAEAEEMEEGGEVEQAKAAVAADAEPAATNRFDRAMTPEEVEAALRILDQSGQEPPGEAEDEEVTDGEITEDATGEDVEAEEEIDLDAIDLPEAADLTTTAVRELYYDGLYDVQDELYRQAIPKLERVIEIDPTLYGAWEALGWSYWNTGRKSETRRLWNRLKALDPGHPLPYVLLATLALEDGNLQEGRRLYEVALGKEPDQSFASRMYNVRFSYARLVYWDGEIGKAVDIFEELHSEDPNRTDVALQLARAYLQLGNYAEALPLWTGLRELADQNPEFVASEALCLLHTGAGDLAVERAEIAIELDPGNPKAIEVLIAAALFGDNPEEALPYLEKLYREQSDPAAKDRVRQQLIRIHVYLYNLDSGKYGLDEAIDLSRERLDENENSIDSILLLAELLLMDDQHEESRRLFQRVVEDFNPYNLRARRGLFEVYLSKRKYKQARIQYEYIRRFDPHNMYLYYYLARIESTRGDFYKAHEMLEKLELAGRRGAVPILLYSPLTSSEYFEEKIPSKRFGEHLAALQEYRFRIIAPPELPESFIAGEGEPWWSDKTVIITFDQVERNSMRIADQHARDNGVVLTAHIPVLDVEDHSSNSCSWDELAEYRDSGYWSFGSALLDTDPKGIIDYDGDKGSSLSNRLWFEDLGEMESPEAYRERITNEFVRSKQIIQSHLGENCGNYVAYPGGDIGQESVTNLEEPFSAVVASAGENYDFGFVQSQFGCAVNGDNPLLYQRYRVSRWDSATNIVEHVYDNHPVFLSLVTRAKYAAFQGKQYLALDLLEKLEDAGYPEELLKKVDKFVRDRLSRRLAAPQDVGSVSEGPLHLRLRDPFLGGQFNYFEDNLDRENWSAYIEGGLNLTPGLEIQGKAGVGELKQRVRDIEHPEYGNQLQFDEEAYGGKAIYTFPNGLFVSGEAVQHEYDSARTNRSELAYVFETQFRPVLAVDLLLQYQHEMEPSALAVWDDISYDQMMAVGMLRIRDWWDASAAAIRYDYSDDNVRDHLQFGTRFFLWERTGLNLGFKYAYTDSDFDRKAYWTPYKLHRYFIEPGFQGTYLRAYYDLRLRLGLGRESVRPEAEEAYAEAIERAARGGYEPFRDEPPSEDWETIFGLSASWDIPFSKYWYFNGRLGYSEGPNYEEFRAHVGLKLKL